jgi:hypothetical protein
MAATQDDDWDQLGNPHPTQEMWILPESEPRVKHYSHCGVTWDWDFAPYCCNVTADPESPCRRIFWKDGKPRVCCLPSISAYGVGPNKLCLDCHREERQAHSDYHSGPAEERCFKMVEYQLNFCQDSSSRPTIKFTGYYNYNNDHVSGHLGEFMINFVNYLEEKLGSDMPPRREKENIMCTHHDGDDYLENVF